MSKFNYKDFLKNSSFLNEAEETEEKFSVDKLEDKVKAILKKEGGAVGVKPLVDAAKELGASKKDLMDVLEKMKSVETHKDGDIIDTDGLNEAEENLEEAEELSLSREKEMVMKLLLDKMQKIANDNPEELTRDFLMKTKNMIDDLMMSDF
tara:strand:+ start:49 stop:501 length:453 start_codon:yes stop_codon:yes gene_type:complete